MSYTKLEVRYIGDGINSSQGLNCRSGEKKKTITLPKRVQEYGDAHGYYSMNISFNLDHIIITGGGQTLFDQDINGGSNEYIRQIVGYDWQY